MLTAHPLFYGLRQQRRATRTLGLALITLVLLQACTLPSRPPPPVVATPPPASEEPIASLDPVEQARALLLEVEAQNPLNATAGRRVLDHILDLPAPDADLLLRADQIWQRLPEQGRATLADRYRGAQIAQYQGADPQQIRARLEPVRDAANPELYRRALRLHAELLRAERDWEAALLTHLRRDALLLLDPGAQHANHRQIWDLLATQPPGVVRHWADHPDLRWSDLEEPERDRLQGWARLFIALRQAERNEAAFDLAITAWRAQHPLHAANAFIDDLRRLTFSPPEATPQRIAVLLPLSGPLGQLGQAVLAGIELELQQATAGSVQLDLYDTEGQPATAETHYRRLLSQGVDAIIGPLTREEVEQILGIGSALTTLVLNRPDTPLSTPISVLSLAPEGDAQAAALEALHSGWQNALILVPHGSFGDRVAQAFSTRFTHLGGHVSATYRFHAQSEELNAEIGTALGIDASTARIRQMRELLRLSLDADPQVRADMDLIFIAGPARDLRLVVPHLHFHRAGRLPLLATSHAYEGHPRPHLDQDLSGLRFPDAPWLYPRIHPELPLREALLRTYTIDDPARRLPRFTALGMDAARAVLQHAQIMQAPHLALEGQSGRWTWEPLERHWQREPIWLTFRNGQPEPLHEDPGAASDEASVDPSLAPSTLIEESTGETAEDQNHAWESPDASTPNTFQPIQPIQPGQGWYTIDP